jgi:tetratricopeptide (TPR) repeat protein
MSVINSMLRDLDRRHAPLPIKAHVQSAPIKNHRIWPRIALALSVVVATAMWGWSQYSPHIVAVSTDNPPIPPEEGKSKGTQDVGMSSTSISASHGLEKNSLGQAVVAIKSGETTSRDKLHEKSSLSSAPLPAGEEKTVREIKIAAEEKPQAQPEVRSAAPIIKQERKIPEDINSERYQLARSALTQNQPQRAYELLRDNPPPIVNATDYHAVLAAVEQQLGHFADASLRYQQLLLLDQNQASWWLGFALSLEGEHRSGDALTAYRHAATLNSLPEAARQYVTARIAALGPIVGQIAEATH